MGKVASSRGPGSRSIRREPDKLLPVHEVVESYVRRALPPEDDVLQAVKAEARLLGIPSITAEAGRVLHLLAKAIHAERAIELGTGTGYSGIWIARGLAPGGKLSTVEGDPGRADEARQRFARAGVADRVEVHVDACLEFIRRAPRGAADLLFVDATKREYPAYLDAARAALRPGGILAADNVFWQGQVFDFDPHSPAAMKVQEAELAGILEFTRRIAGPEWVTTILPFGDGLSVSVKS